MKTKILIVVLLFLTVTALAKEKQLTITDHSVELVITKKTTLVQLKKLAKIIKEESNIDFTFSDVIKDMLGNLSQVTIQVDSNDGVKSSGKLLVGSIYEVGFVRNYNADPNAPLEKKLFIGNIREREVELD